MSDSDSEVTVSVTMRERDHRALRAAAEVAGMDLDDYLAWAMRLLAEQATTSGPRRGRAAGPVAARRIGVQAEEPEAQAWTES
ncbi:hypothetical protein ACWEKT_35730 [Nocardia takedensis]